MKRYFCFFLLFTLILSACNNTDTTSPTSEAVSDVSFEETSSKETFSSEEISSSIEDEVVCISDGFEGFISVSGKKLIDENGKEYFMEGMAFGNTVFNNPSTPSSFHHTESDYEIISDLGFNCVRFYLNYGLFEDDLAPYEYKESGFEWLDKNIEWAKKNDIRLVLNMHYPQGGYQSAGNGHALWTDPENMKRLTALWTEIARRYADEPTIIGYGLINEPGIPVEYNEQAMLIYTKAVQDMVDSIRTVNTTHIIFVEKIAFVQDSVTLERRWPILNDRCNWPEIVGENIVYEFHTYSPHTFTHQKDADNLAHYPDDSKIENSGTTETISTTNGTKAVFSDDGWQKLEVEGVKCTEENQIVRFNLVTSYIGAGGKVYIDDILIEEYDADGNLVKVLANLNYNKNTTVYFWSSTENKLTGYSSSSDGVDGSGCIWVGDIDQYGDGASYSFMGKPDHTYKASASIRLENVSKTVSAYPRMLLLSSSDAQVWDKEYLEYCVSEEIDFSNKYNVPIYCGEFGTDNLSFSSGGDVWVEDMLDILIENGIHLNYHAYHEEMFGLYGNSAYTYPGNVNQKLYDIFIDKLK